MNLTRVSHDVLKTEQSRWVAASTQRARGGFYVDLAANDPEQHSNTVWLERALNWRGICIEPVARYANLLRAMRSCTVVQAVVDEVEHAIIFADNMGADSGIKDNAIRADKDRHMSSKQQKQAAQVQQMQTMTLGQILDAQHAPAYVDFLSLDVEGAEERALSPTSFPWSRYRFGLISIERPPPRLNAALFAHGYLFVKNIGTQDTLYVHSSHINAAQLARNSSFIQQPSKCFGNRKRIHRMSRRSTAGDGRQGCHPFLSYGCCAWPGFPDVVGGTRYGPNGSAVKNHPGYKPGVCPGSLGC